MNTFVGEAHRLQWTNNTGADVASGDVVVLGDCISIAVIAVATSAVGTLEVDGIHDLDADSATAFVFGDQLYWDVYAEKLYREPGWTRLPAGLAAETKAQSTAKCEVMINVNTDRGRNSEDLIVYFDDFLDPNVSLAAPPVGWAAIDTSSSGTPTLVNAGVNGGVVEAKFTSTDQAEAIGINHGDKLQFDIDSLVMAMFRFRAPTLNALDALIVGMGSAHNDDPDSITAGAWIHCDGTQNVGCESDDGTTDEDDQDSALDLGNDVWAKLVLDLTNKSSVKFYLSVNDPTTALARVQSATTFDIDQYAANLQPMAFITKASGAHQTNFDIDYAGVVAKR